MCQAETDLPGPTAGAVKLRAFLQHFTTGRTGGGWRLPDPSIASRSGQDRPAQGQGSKVGKGPSVPTLAASLTTLLLRLESRLCASAAVSPSGHPGEGTG